MHASPKRYRKKQRPGGIHKRMHEAQEEIQQESSAHTLLMNLFAQGCISAVLCHQISQAVQRDVELAGQGFVFPDLERLARIKEGRNVTRSVHNQLNQCQDLPQPCYAHIPFSDGHHPSGIVLPHELFAAIFHDKAQWQTMILPDPDQLPSFWDALDAHPALDNHPVKQKKHFRTHALPMTMHGDEVPCMGVGKIWSRSVLNFSWCSLLANALGGKMADIMLYIWGCFEKFCIQTTDNTLGTMDSFYRILAWSFQALYQGIWPKTDWRGFTFPDGSINAKRAGKSLAGGYSGVLLFLCGDLDYFQKWLQCPASTNHSKPCVQCKATFYGPSTWQDNRPVAVWKGSCLTTANWQTHWKTSCPLFLLPGMSCWSIAYDFMHNFYLGWLQHFYGSVFYLLTHVCMEGEPLQNLLNLALFLKNVQKKDKTRQAYRQRLSKLSMFTRQTGFPKLKGRASDIKGLDLALCKAWEHFAQGNDDPHLQLVMDFLALNVDIGDLLSTYHPRYGCTFVPEPKYTELVQKISSMAQIHVILRDHYEGDKLFNITSKTHFAIHSILLSSTIHPCLTWCFKGESMMRVAQRLWKSCLAGNKHWNVGNVAARKYLHMLALRFRDTKR